MFHWSTKILGCFFFLGCTDRDEHSWAMDNNGCSHFPYLLNDHRSSGRYKVGFLSTKQFLPGGNCVHFSGTLQWMPPEIVPFAPPKKKERLPITIFFAARFDLPPSKSYHQIFIFLLSGSSYKPSFATGQLEGSSSPATWSVWNSDRKRLQTWCQPSGNGSTSCFPSLLGGSSHGGK